MTNEQRESNKLIAEFMTDIPAVNEKYAFKQFPNYFEATIAPDCGLCWVSVMHLSYHLSFDWLMPVVDKCWKNQGKFGEGLGYFQNVTIFKSIEEVYDAVIVFIKWYNENKEETK